MINGQEYKGGSLLDAVEPFTDEKKARRGSQLVSTADLSDYRREGAAIRRAPSCLPRWSGGRLSAQRDPIL